jgi:hypothetical protein
VTAADAVGTGRIGATNGEIGSGAIAFRMELVTVTRAGVRGGTTRIQIGAVSSLGGVGVINNRSARRALSSFFAVACSAR